MSLGNYRDMWLFAEANDGKFVPVAIEMISEARRLMDKYNADYNEQERVVAVVIGENVDHLAKEAITYGADVVVQLDHPELAHFRLEPYTRAVGRVSEAKTEWKDYDKPRYFAFPATANGRDLSATVLAVLESGLASDCNLLYIEDVEIRHPVKTGGPPKVYERILHMKRPDFSGFEWSTILCLDNPDKDFHPQACSVIPGSFKAAAADPSRKGEIRKEEVYFEEQDLRIKIKSRRKLDKGVDLSQDRIIVALGRGIGDDPTRGIKIGVDLADKLGAGVGISRGIVTASYPLDASVEQYAEEVRQIGETGQVVTPNVYIALGISGAIQHKKGMDQSKFIVTINKDADVPIREFSDVFVKGDLFEVVPALMKALEKEGYKK